MSSNDVMMWLLVTFKKRVVGVREGGNVQTEEEDCEAERLLLVDQDAGPRGQVVHGELADLHQVRDKLA